MPIPDFCPICEQATLHDFEEVEFIINGEPKKILVCRICAGLLKWYRENCRLRQQKP